VAEHLDDLAKAWHPGDPEAAKSLCESWCPRDSASGSDVRQGIQGS
jgi:hypothetical protein